MRESKKLSEETAVPKDEASDARRDEIEQWLADLTSAVIYLDDRANARMSGAIRNRLQSRAKAVREKGIQTT